MKKNYFFSHLVLLAAIAAVAIVPARAQQLVDGVYQISNAEEFVNFGNMVAAGADSIKGELTADIDLSGVEWAPIGTEAVPFCGELNGNFHRIKNLVIDSTADYQGLFGYIGSSTFRNLFIDSSCSITGGSYVAGIAAGGTKSGTAYFINCGNEANITGTGANVAGIVGVSMANAVKFIIKNCYNSGTISGGRESAAISGWGAGNAEVDGVINTGAVSGLDGNNSLIRSAGSLNNAYDINGLQGTAIDADALASGAFAYMLNGYQADSVKWCQNIDAEGKDVDAFPVPDTVNHAKVYASGELRCDGAIMPDLTYTNTYSVPTIPDHDFVNGICDICGTPEPNYVPLNDSVYEVSTPDQLNWIAVSVNKATGKKFYVRLLEDIDFSAYTSQGTVIGIGGHDYQGWFDGQGHTVNIDFETDKDYTSLFRFVKNGVVKNLVTEGTIVTSSQHAAGVVAYVVDTTKVINCISKVNIVTTFTGDGSCGGITSVANKGSKIVNCGFLGSIAGDNAGCCCGIVGWSSDTGGMTVENCFVAADLQAATADNPSMVFARNTPKLINCYYTNAGKFTPDAGSTQIDETGIDNGMLCYTLNAKIDTVVWFQNLDNGQDADAYPVPFSDHGIVYATGSVHCDGTPAEVNGYSNTEGTVVTLPHDFQEGVCSYCHTVQEDYMQPVDGYYELKTPGELNWFARMVNLKKENGGMNARLMSDIDFSEISERDSVRIGINNQIDYTGTFDGQGHKITVNYNTNTTPAALILSANEATIKNLHVTGKLTTMNKYAAGIVYWAGHSVMENCVSDVDIESGLVGDGTFGGLISCPDTHTIIKNCAFYGKINAPQSFGNGGILGWSGGGGGCVIDNCVMAAQMTVAEGDNAVMGRNNPTIRNSYFVDPGMVTINATAQEVDASQLSSGEIAFKLNAYQNGGTPWVQTLGTDEYPYPTGDHEKVYATGKVICEGAMLEVTYTNTEGELTYAPHEYGDDGICTICGARLISTPAQLLAASSDFNNGYTLPDVTLRLAADIDMTGITDYAGIGTETIPYAGHFDGQGHKISNLKIENDLKNQGLFGVITSGALIENVVVDSTCSVKCNSYAAGIVGMSASTSTGIVTIRNCGNEANVTVDSNTGVNAAGIFGVNMGSASQVRIYNCYNTGNISGHAECAAISGWLGGNAEVTNAYNIGKVEGLSGTNTFYRSDSNTPYLTNCFETIGNQVDSVTIEQVINGALCFMLNDSVQGGTPYYQTLGTEMHPVLFGSNSKVYEVNGNYTNDIVGIDETKVTPRAADGRKHIYTVDGVEIPALQKGINIVREADGSVKKVLVK